MSFKSVKTQLYLGVLPLHLHYGFGCFFSGIMQLMTKFLISSTQLLDLQHNAGFELCVIVADLLAILPSNVHPSIFTNNPDFEDVLESLDTGSQNFISTVSNEVHDYE